MTALETIKLDIQTAQERVEKLIRLKLFIESKTPEFWKELPEPTVYDSRLDFDHLSHDGVMQVMKAFGAGKWNKEPSYNGSRVDYTTEVGGVAIRCWAGEPPPNCKIIEEEYEVPAEPAKKLKRYRIECVTPEVAA